MVECHFPKVDVAGSNPVSRSKALFLLDAKEPLQEIPWKEQYLNSYRGTPYVNTASLNRHIAELKQRVAEKDKEIAKLRAELESAKSVQVKS